MCLPKQLQCNAQSPLLRQFLPYLMNKTWLLSGWCLWPRIVSITVSNVAILFNKTAWLRYNLIWMNLSYLTIPFFNHIAAWFTNCTISEVTSRLHGPILTYVKSRSSSILVMTTITLIDPTNNQSCLNYRHLLHVLNIPCHFMVLALKYNTVVQLQLIHHSIQVVSCWTPLVGRSRRAALMSPLHSQL